MRSNARLGGWSPTAAPHRQVAGSCPTRGKAGWRSTLALVVLATVSFASSTARAAPMIRGSLVEDNPNVESKAATLTIKPSNHLHENGFRFMVRLGGFKLSSTGEKLDLSNRAFGINLYSRAPSSPGCTQYYSPFTPAGTGTHTQMVFTATDLRQPPLPSGPLFPELSAGTPVQICGDANFGFGFGPYLGIKVGPDHD